MKHSRFFTTLCAGVLAFSSTAAILPAELTVFAEAETDYHSETHAQDGGTIQWTLKSDGTVIISGSGRMQDTDNSPLEHYLSNENSNPHHYTVKKVIVEEGITHLGCNSFYSGEFFSGEHFKELTAVSLPESLESIGSCAFYGCTSLKEINIPENVSRIGNAAFTDTPWYEAYCKQFDDGFVIINHVLLETPSTETVIIPEGVKSIAPHAVLSENIKRVVIPDSVTHLAEDAFCGCENLAEIEIPESVTEIGFEAFAATKWIENKRAENPFVTVNGILIDGTACKGDITIPNGIDSIGTGAFAGAAELTGIVIPDSVKTINGFAMMLCPKLKSVTFPNSLSEIPALACFGCHALTDICYSESIRVIGEGAFMDCKSLVDITIPETVTEVKIFAFLFCPQLRNVTFLNPYCRIYGCSCTFARDFLLDFDDNYKTSDYLLGKVYGYSGSLAEAAAENDEYPFESLGEIPEKDFPKPLMYGDVTLDRNLNVADAVLLARFLTEDADAALTNDGRICADANDSGSTDLEDVAFILRRIAKLEPTPFDVFVFDRTAREQQRMNLLDMHNLFKHKFPDTGI